MYSVVLATMLTAGGTTPAWCHHHCSGYVGCYSCYSCYSYSCYCGGAYYYPRHHWHGCHSCYGCYGCYTCSACCGGAVYYSSCYSCSPCCGGVIVNPAPKVIDVQKSGGVVQEQPALASAAKTSRVTVVVPAEARLWVDGVECPLPSTTRSFNTPPLNPNQQYFYNMKIEVARDGRTISETQRVLITPGQEVRVDFNNVGALATASR